MLSESKIIGFLKNQFPEQIGDDAAILPLSKHKSYVISKDILVEDIHFRFKYHQACHLAHKALQVNISDIAAMGATPQYVLLGLAIPDHGRIYIDQFLENFSAICKASSIILIGGDTTKSPDKLFISITIIGLIANSHIKFRNRAEDGNLICIAGNLGDAHIGFTALERNIAGLEPFKENFLKPNALLKEGLWFSKQRDVTAMMDISDGLFIDLKRLCMASNVGAKVDIDKLKFSDTFKLACEILKLDPMVTLLTGGEDYGLLLTIKPEAYSRIASKFKACFGYQLKAIGQITKGSEVHFIQNNQLKTLNLQPFAHFGESL
jgi:thiamine-monophosphate kinase